MKLLRILVVCSSFLTAAIPAQAAAIALLPADRFVAPGDIVTLEIVVSGLDGGVVGDFDFDIAFDPDVLLFLGYMLGPLLGDVAAGEALDFSFGLVSPGLLNITELSLVSAAELSLLQTEPLSLASLEFEIGSLAPGTSTLVHLQDINALGNGDGSAIPVSSASSSRLTRSDAPSVPEPHILVLLLAGFYRTLRRAPRT